MMETDPALAARYRSLALARRSGAPGNALPASFLVVDAARQRLGFLKEGQLILDFQISTARNGLGCEEGSYRTPTGWHRIHARIGAGEPTGTIFKARVPTGECWQGEPREEDLILTRILTLEGLEPGHNQGPGHDSLQRYIYIHGTNQEAEIGQPVSHGCIRMCNADVLQLFDAVEAGLPVLIAEGSELQDPLGLGRLHFAGVGGSGMSALAQFVAMRGGSASGSDRSFDRGQNGTSRTQLEALNIQIFPQDGSGVGDDCAAVVYSTAVEETVPDFAEARRQGIPLLHRSELLAHLVALHRTLAITGTSGKSTTTAMAFEILRGCGLDPSVITGGDLRQLQSEGLWGNAWAGSSDLLVIEADESDGSLVRYQPAVGLVLNLQKDHKEEAIVAEMFRTFKARTREAFIVSSDANLSELREAALTFDMGEITDLETGPEGSTFKFKGTHFTLPVPGRHNVENALAAITACAALGVTLEAMVDPLARFQGVARRFQLLGSARGVQVIDDFGHNPAKVAASLRTARLRAKRVLAVFQPHGYGPMRFLRADFVKTFAEELRPEDRFWMLEVFYAGGTATRDFSSADIVEEIRQQGVHAEFGPSREWLAARIASEAKEGDLVLVMGARDPSLTAFARSILEALSR